MATFRINFRDSDRSPRLLDAGIADGTNPSVRRCGFMSDPWRSQSDGSALPVLGIVGAIMAVVGLFFFAFYSLAQPTVYKNPGLAAYTPPAATRLVPLPRVSDAPELAPLPDLPPSPLTAMAQAQATDKQATDQPASEKPARRARQAAHRHAPAVPGGYDQQPSGYAQQNYEYRDWNGNRAGAGGWNGNRAGAGGSNSNRAGTGGSNSNRAWAGGFKTWF
jgi:hypothetical protein